MDSIRRILVTTDLSKASELALPWAEMIARQCEAQLSLLYLLSTVSFEPYEVASPNEADFAKAQQNARQRMERMAHERLINQQVQIETVQCQHPHAGILEYADKGLFDLIVMATHGRSGIRHLLLGSVTERVVHHSKIPVLCVRGGEDPYLEQGQIRRVLCPIDFSQHSWHGLSAGVQLAKRFDAAIDVLHVAPGEASEHAGTVYAHANDPTLWELRERLRSFVSKAEEEGTATHLHLMRGSVPRCINQFADDNRDDLIAMATHGHDALGDYLLGSNTERVVRHSNHPVLVYPSRP